MNFLKYNLTLALSQEMPEKTLVVNTINPHSFCVAHKDLHFQDALKNSDVLLPDGIGIVWAAKFLHRKKIKKVSGYDLHLHYLNLLNESGSGKVFYLGSTGETLNKIKQRVLNEFPNLQVEKFSPPYRENFSMNENREMISRINAFEPDLLFVGMTAPKQEKWVYEHKSELNVKVIGSIGAVFDFYGGTIPRAPDWLIKLGLEWFHRSIKNYRLLKRNLISNPKFIWLILNEKLK